MANVQGSCISGLSAVKRNMDIEFVVGILGHSMLHSLPAIASILAFGTLVCRVVSVNVISLIEFLRLVAL